MSHPPGSRAGSEERKSSPQSTENFARLTVILRENFQLDPGDLDFGLYRIMNLKTAEITTFLNMASSRVLETSGTASTGSNIRISTSVRFPWWSRR